MKKKLSLLAIIVLALFVAYFSTNNNKKTNDNPSKTPEEVLGVTKAVPDTVLFKGQEYKVYSTPFFDGEQISLIPNFTERVVASDLKSKNNCVYLVNGGFYTQEARPVGYFRSGDSLIKDEKVSVLFDSFFTINDLRVPRITRELPTDNLVLGIQVGPLLVENSYVQKLSIKNDKKARRIVVAINGKNQVTFIIIVTKESDFSGPFMADIPEILDTWSKNTATPLADATNLDGGSASAFIGPNIFFNEISPIGSAFCIK